MKFKSIKVLVFQIVTVFVTISAERIIFNSTNDNNERPVVELKSGLVIIGTLNKTSGLHKTFYAYRGIPFAQPPIGDLRFRPPVALPQNLTGHIIDASQDKSQCVQLGIPVEGTEDCLYINVYTPVTNQNNLHNNYESLPVMVWIHGGAFDVGNNSYALFGPDYILNENVIVVTLNYRLGVFGFLSTEDEASPGNYGLKDQILALHWVQNNIECFGGNNSKVTVFSESAGAASASYLSQTPLTNGLFQKAIFESGNSITPWALTRNSKKVAFAVGACFNINSTSTQNLVDSLRKVDYKSLANAETVASLEDALTADLLNGLSFGPTIEPPHPGAVVTNYSHEQLRNGLFQRIPYLMGINSQEGIPFEQILNYVRSYLIKYDLTSGSLVPASLNIKNSTVKDLVNSIIKHHYFGNASITVSGNRLVKFISDDQFNRPITEAALLYSQYSPVYFYEFAYQGPLGSGNRTTPGVGHADELNYLFKREKYPGSPTSFDLLTRRRLVKLWTNFAKTGNPTPTRDPLLQNISWPVTNVDKSFNLHYLNINRSLTIMSNPKRESYLFWSDVFKNYGNPPYSTY